MAIVENFWLKDQKKRLADAVIYQAYGQTRSRKLAASVANPRTQSQMMQRVKWSNLVNFYRANKKWMKYAFETKKQTQSEYNKLMSLNVSTSPIYLTKSQAAAGGCVVAPYLITQGSLPSIEMNWGGSSFSTNIFTNDPSGLLFGGNVANFTRTLLDYNPALREGDQLSFIIALQMTNAVTGTPYIVVREYEIILDLSDTMPVSRYLPVDHFSCDDVADMNPIIVGPNNLVGGMALILSRTISGKTYVSTQRLMLCGVDDIVQQYSSAAQLAEAIASYGDQSDAFLSSTSADPAGSGGYPLSIIGATLNNVTLPIGERYVAPGGLMSYPMSITFNQDIVGDSFGLEVNYWSNGVLERETILEATHSQNRVTGSFPAGAEDIAGCAIDSVVAIVDGVRYSAAFLVLNSDTIGGLE